MDKMIFLSYVAEDENHNDESCFVSGFILNGEVNILNEVIGIDAQRTYEMLVSEEDRVEEDMLVLYLYTDDDPDASFKYEMRVSRFDPGVFDSKSTGDLSILSVIHFDDLNNELLNKINGGIIDEL